MIVRVRLYGSLRRLALPGTPGRWVGDVPLGTRIEDLIRLLGTLPGEVYVASINGELQPFSTEIVEGSEVILAPPVGGGSQTTRTPHQSARRLIAAVAVKANTLDFVQREKT